MSKPDPNLTSTKLIQHTNYDRLYDTVLGKMSSWTTPMLLNMIASLLTSAESDEANWGAIDALTDIVRTRSPPMTFATNP